jgi:demethylmenaquinone methyltransferase/2-methoxy-6-polyprenyl-1,4-benzoquinol methylase
MATVFMKWLETSPQDYERGIQILTLGRLGKLKGKIARQYVNAGDRVLEIGCGTGTLAILMAEKGANVVGIDASPAMLEEAQTKIAQREMGERVTIKFLDASQIADEFQPTSFDLIVSTLVFSEIPYDEQRHVLEACRRLLAPGGRLLIADEVIPPSRLKRILYSMIRSPLVLVTWLLTRMSLYRSPLSWRPKPRVAWFIESLCVLCSLTCGLYSSASSPPIQKCARVCMPSEIRARKTLSW